MSVSPGNVVKMTYSGSPGISCPLMYEGGEDRGTAAEYTSSKAGEARGSASASAARTKPTKKGVGEMVYIALCAVYQKDLREEVSGGC